MVWFELKAEKFKPEYAGKMGFYLKLPADFIREKREWPSIGAILCAKNGNFDIKYSLRDINFSI